MEPYGNAAKQVLIVGEAPGKTEDEMGRPFIGKAGTFLRDTLRRIGVNMDRDALTTNSLICRPPNNATPDKKQIAYCRPNLLNTIRENEPRVIVTLGRSALVSVLRTCWKDEIGELGKWVGWQIPFEKHWICPTYHPSFLLRTKSQMMDRLFEDHLAAAFDIRTDPPKREDFEKQVEILYAPDAVRRGLVDMDRRGGWVAFDYETNCLKPEYPDARIYSCAMSNGERTIAFPWDSEVAKHVGWFLRSKGTKKIASNVQFEQRWTLKTFGHGVSRWGWDTMVATHCLDNRTGICSLKFQSLVVMGVPSYNDNIAPYLESHKGHYNRIREIAMPTLLLYNGIDALLETRLAMVQMKEIGK